MFLNLLQKLLSRIQAHIKEEKKLFMILLAGFAIRIFYVYFCTNYKDLLFSDMGGYWQRALDRYNGQIFDYGQWVSWAPFFHYYLTFLFQVFDLLGLSKYRLETVLFLNIIYSIISIYFFYYLTEYFIKSVNYRLLATFFYCFHYPLIYLDAFVLSENLSMPIIITSLYLILKYHENKKLAFFIGAFFGIAVCARPAVGLLVISFFLYIIFVNKYSFDTFGRALIFSLGFFIVIGLVTLENMRVSDGELRSLAGNGGLGFFIQQCKVQHVRSDYKGYVFEILNPTYLGHPDLARMSFRTDRSLHDEDYFYNLGYECIKKNPKIWIENFISLKSIFVGPLFPSVPECKGFEPLIKFSDYVFIFLFPSLFLLYILVKDKLIDLKKVILLISIPLFIMITNYFYAVEQRYFYPTIFTFYISFFTFLQYKKNYRVILNLYILTVVIMMYYFVRID